MQQNVIKILRVFDGKNSTLSHLYIGGIFQCYLLEDKTRDAKIYARTAIPEGVYPLVFRKEGKFHSDYSRRFAFHKGMVEIDKIPNYDFVMFHIGNTHLNTAGCPLLGNGFVLENEDYKVVDSTAAYTRVYPVLAQMVASGGAMVEVKNLF